MVELLRSYFDHAVIRGDATLGEARWSFDGHANAIDAMAALRTGTAILAPVGGNGAIGYGALGSPDGGGAFQLQATKSVGLLVQFAAGATDQEKSVALASAAVTIVETVRANDSQAGDLVLVDSNGQDTDAVISALTKSSGVSSAEVNSTLGVQAISNDFYYANGSMWGMYGDKTTPANAYGSQAGEAWAAGYTGKSTIVVGDIDSGLDYTHPDLYLNVWLNQGELPRTMALVDYDQDGLITFRDLNQTVNSGFVSDLNLNGRIDAGDLLQDARWSDHVDQNGNGYIDDLIGWDFVNNDNNPYDDNGHGTHTAGTIGAMGANGTGVVGVNWNVEIMALKFLDASGSGALSNAIKALDYYTAASAADQAKQWSSEFIGTNNSWGGGAFSQALLNAIVRGAKQDALFIAAAGNGGSDSRGDNNDAVPNYPSNYSTLSGAGYEAVIAVAALTSSGAIASYSNYGLNTVDLGAPGSNIWSSVPGGYASYSGTSMATPHVTGALALYASMHPDYTASQLREALLDSTVATSSLTGKTETGGRLDVGMLTQYLPAQPAVTIGLLSDTGSSATDLVTSQGIIGGTSNPMAIVHFTLNGQLVAPTATADANGVWAIDASVLADGQYTVVASKTSSGGATATSSLTFTLDTTEPVPLLTEVVQSGGLATLTGSTGGSAGETVSIYDGNSLVATTITSNGGAFSTTTSATPLSTHVYSVTATDIAGNVGTTGSSSADLIQSRNGADTLTGGGGQDTFVYHAASESTSSAPDTITDFVHGADKIDFTNIAGISAANGVPLFQGNIVATGNVKLDAHSVGFIELGGNTWVVVNTSNNIETVSADMHIVLVGVGLGLSATDFHHL